MGRERRLCRGGSSDDDVRTGDRLVQVGAIVLPAGRQDACDDAHVGKRGSHNAGKGVYARVHRSVEDVAVLDGRVGGEKKREMGLDLCSGSDGNNICGRGIGGQEEPSGQKGPCTRSRINLSVGAIE